MEIIELYLKDWHQLLFILSFLWFFTKYRNSRDTIVGLVAIVMMLVGIGFGVNIILGGSNTFPLRLFDGSNGFIPIELIDKDKTGGLTIFGWVILCLMILMSIGDVPEAKQPTEGKQKSNANPAKQGSSDAKKIESGKAEVVKPEVNPVDKAVDDDLFESAEASTEDDIFKNL